VSAFDVAHSFALIFYYDNLYVQRSVQTLLYDSGSFLTSMGGNLGLTVGFSCLSVGFAVVAMTNKWLKRLKKAEVGS
jgi:hypothetical protein